MHQPDDAQLVAAVGHGDMEALGELVRRHQAGVVAFGYRMLGRWDAAEDMAQETFLRVSRAAARYRPRAKFTTWLYRIATNLCLDTRRRWARAPEALAGDGPARPVDPDPLETSERVEDVRRAVAHLPARQRVALLLHRYQEMDHKEIAEATGWTVSAVESLLVRAYANLRKALAPWKEI